MFVLPGRQCCDSTDPNRTPRCNKSQASYALLLPTNPIDGTDQTQVSQILRA